MPAAAAAELTTDQAYAGTISRSEQDFEVREDRARTTPSGKYMSPLPLLVIFLLALIGVIVFAGLDYLVFSIRIGRSRCWSR
ncbi:hypothetical protein ACWGKW_24100 [Streptomyces sp. NPDC054766]